MVGSRFKMKITMSEKDFNKKMMNDFNILIKLMDNT